MNALEFEDSDYYTGPVLTEAMIHQAQMALGHTLPASYIALLRFRNGGVPTRRRLPTTFATSWAPDHFEISAIRGLGGIWGIDGPGPLSSPALIAEWDYPAIGIVICDTPSAGEDTVMLDYRESAVEPAVAYIDEDRVPRIVASSFSDFVARLE